VIIQEIIPGPEDRNYSIVGYFDKNHNPQALFACHRLRGWPKGFGNSSYIESYSLSKLNTIKNGIITYLDQIGYSGVMEAEIKRDPRDGVFKLIEINARSWWQNSLPTKCGVNIIYTAYLDSIGIKTPYSEHYEIGIYWMHPLNDLQFFLRFHPEKLGEWFGSLRKTEDLAYFCKHDLSPWVVKNLQNIVRIIEAGSSRITSPIL
jgi:D-aspartate ligase